MEDPKNLVFDISSDEEAADNGCGGGGGGGGGGDSIIDFKWIKKLLDVDDEENEEKGVKDGGETDDSDDLVVVREVCGSQRKQSDDESDDDDCVVLDSDPDKPKAVEGEKDGFGDDSDDLVVVSEKGVVACRDFPHSRHLCAKFPFSSSGHEIHCDQCHCYVCDSLAPCMYWGTGVSSVDHCHATDKDAFWISQRSSSRSVKVPVPIHAPAVHHMDISIRRPPMANQSSPLVPNLVEHNQVMRQFTVRPCSTPTNSGVPNVIIQGPRPGYVLPGNKYPTHLISKHLAETSPHVSSTDRRHNNSNMGAQQAVFKRTVPSRSTLSSGRTGLNPSSPHYGSRFPTNLPAMRRWKGSHGGISSASHAYQSSISDVLSPQTDPVLNNGFSNTMPPQMLSQQNRGSGNGNGILLQPQMVAQQHNSSGYTNYLPQTSLHLPVDDLYDVPVLTQQLVSSRTPGNAVCNASFVSSPQTNYQPDMGYGFMNTTHTSHQLTGLTQQNEGRTVEYSEPTQSQSLRQVEADNEFLPVPLSDAGRSSVDPFVPYPSPEYNQPSIISSSHDRLHEGNQTFPEALGSNVAVSDSCPVSCTSPSTQLPGCNSQPQNAEQTDHYLANTNFHHQYATLTDFGTTDLEAWLSVDHSVPNTLGISVPPLLNTPIPSPELASLDVCGMFFD